jgi:hypothetical protein
VGSADPVRGQEADAGDLLGRQIRIVAQDPDRVRAVLTSQPLGQSRSEPQTLQVRERFGLRGAAAHGLGDRRRLLRPDAADLAQPARLRGDHLERTVAELLHEPLGEGGPDAVDQTRTEVALDALARARCHRREGLDLEALAVLRVLLEAAAHLQRLAGRHRAEVADQHDAALVPLRGGVEHAEAAVLALEDDLVHGHRQRFLAAHAPSCVSRSYTRAPGANAESRFVPARERQIDLSRGALLTHRACSSRSHRGRIHRPRRCACLPSYARGTRPDAAGSPARR